VQAEAQQIDLKNRATSPSMADNLILIPTDLSEVAENAVLHGLVLAQSMQQSHVRLLHVCDTREDAGNGVCEEHMLQMQQELMKCKERCEGAGGVRIEIQIKKGNLFKVIHKVAASVKPRFMVMGTHGKQGLQHLFGSHALRVVLDAPCPVLVIRDVPPPAGYRHIAIPVSSETNPAGLIEWGGFLGKLFHAEIHIFRSAEPNPDRNKITDKIVAQVTAAFTEQLVKWNITHAASPHDFSAQVIAYAETIRPDLVLTMTMPERSASGYTFYDWNERLMFNPARIPVMFIDKG
jgi:nucleotide-binding universal stress UspA family protein